MNSEKPALPVPSSSSNSSEEVVNITADNNAHALHKTQSINRPEELQGFEIDLAYEDPEAERVLSRIKSHADPNSQDFNEKDPWKYPVDTVTGFRIVTFVENDKENPLLGIQVENGSRLSTLVSFVSWLPLPLVLLLVI